MTLKQQFDLWCAMTFSGELECNLRIVLRAAFYSGVALGQKSSENYLPEYERFIAANIAELKRSKAVN